MAIDRHATGLSVVRICVGLFFLFEGVGKFSWFADPSILGRQLDGWLHAVPAASWSHTFLERVAIPGTPTFARLVPLGELSSGVALVAGFWTPLFAFLAFLMALTFQFASGALFKYTVLTSGYALPVLGSTLGLAVGGVRLPWSVSGGGAKPARAVKTSHA
jgi:uncharacterized membrane protein YphA (DoxX/SURF4 family)